MLISTFVVVFFFILLHFFFISFSFTTSAWKIPSYIYPSSLVSPIVRPSKKVIPSKLNFLLPYHYQRTTLSQPKLNSNILTGHCTVCTNESIWCSLFPNNFKSSIERWLTLNALQDHNLLLIISKPLLMESCTKQIALEISSSIKWMTSNLLPDDDNSTLRACILSIINFFTFSAISNISKHSIVQLCDIMSYAFR